MRELHEEVAARAAGVRYLGTLESIFTHEGTPGHEIALVYEVELADRALCEHDRFLGREADGAPLDCVWVPVDVLGDGQIPLYPEGVLELLAADGSSAKAR